MAWFATPRCSPVYIGYALVGKVSICELDIYPARQIQHHPDRETELHGVLDGDCRYADTTEYQVHI